MGPRPRDIDLSAGLDVAFLGVILVGVVQFAKSVAAAPDGTPSLLRLSAGGVPSTAPELGLLPPAAGDTIAHGPVGPDPAWTLLAVAALFALVLGSVWLWVRQPFTRGNRRR